ncbi:endopeptidase La [Ethanoligenens harbinense]|uniref:Lon protease n=1 Tax=Ethanoligenens harbinense (strain DSM 18485 / JCM 12961 / CGMCC 1.5033 / YUAN-3) TaxID=663278 RepID=E6U8P0_ETHHY|nr:endopeptidase La [Ethanoligenens harbinense]ADU26031.1 ATP-dependent protease La [Ethanoligenens harbinense YUAN-3]AVQ95176.1 endopeptidase La [Ethanoligenens harbinense YUAN-3]AYF37866.1 endopeptidase La [Ethanoligenens harbinense]AYF40590.1 endopeptidase La [Ethanoligenens harbinense]QCN91423.1 endopeptidase La [Ethanoligenens harbinense]
MNTQAPRENTTLPLLPLRGMVVFPGTLLNFDVGRKKSAFAINESMKADQMLFLVAQKDIRTEEPTAENFHVMGTVARIRQLLHVSGENIKVSVEGLFRARLCEIVQEDPYFVAAVEPCAETGRAPRAATAQALLRQAQDLVGEYTEIGPKLPEELLTEIVAGKEPGKTADYIASNILPQQEDKQTALEELSPVKRLTLVLRMLRHEIEVLRLEQEIAQKVQERIDKGQRDYYLREQLKTLAEELGDQSEADESARYHQAVDKLALPEESAKKLHKEADRLARMPQGSHEATVVRSWLDACLTLPWNKESKDKIDLAQAQKVLDAGHYGMKKVKDRILESLAVRKLAPEQKGQILCLEGPPGVGKTTIARAVAKSLGRRFARVSLGGIRDEADIRGHRKTYIGAMPGRVLTALTQAGTRNPVLLLDEIDKMCESYQGDPSAALLEVLDAEQNHAFRDHYIELPFDLSDVLFITTANNIDTIPAPLLDRMELIELPSYTREEKFQIAKRHLLTRQLHTHGLTRRTLKVSDAVLYDLIDFYTREAGVRRLERQIAALCRKAARVIAAGEQKTVSVGPEQLESLLGPHRFRPESIPSKDEVGVVTGLAWTSVGGETMPVEVAVLDGSGKVELTGSLGDVMKESAMAAISYIRSKADALGIAHDFYKTKDLHIHVPEGAIPKDGPSAGVTMATALTSALLGLPVRRDIAMTGEITLRGRVLPIGGLREKSMAAYRAGVRAVIIPQDNQPDLAEVDKVVKEHVRFIPADHMDTVLQNAILFPPQAGTARAEAAAQTAPPLPVPPVAHTSAPVVEQ